MRTRDLFYTISALCLLILGPSTAASGALVTSGDFSFDSEVDINTGSGRLDIVMFAGNASPNDPGIPAVNNGLPGGGSTFNGNWPMAGDPNTLTVGELEAFILSALGYPYDELVIFIDTNEPGSAAQKLFTINDLTIQIGTTTFSTAEPVVLDGSVGSGYNDYVVRGFPTPILLSAFNDSDLITVHLEMSGLDDGFEEYHLGAIPEPATVGLMVLGVALCGLKRRAVRKAS